MTNKVDPLVRLSADGNGETECIVIAGSFEEAKKGLEPYVSKIVKSYPFISAFGARVSIHKLDDLAQLPFVKAVASASTCRVTMDKAREICGAEALNAEGITGGGVTVAVIDTGVTPHLDFTVPKNRIIWFEDLVNGKREPYDDNGHGSAVSGILCGNGLISGGKYKGIASGASLVSVKAMNSEGEGTAFDILEGMQWVYNNREKFNIKVLCMSFGTPPLKSNDPLIMGAEALWRSGVTVVASAGNSGPKQNTITSPGACPNIITVGGMGVNEKGIFIADFSSRGPYKRFVKPELVAPAVDITCCGADEFYTTLSGTSMSTPIVAGLCALIFCKKPDYTPDKIKDMLITNCKSLNFSSDECGYGMAILQSHELLL